MVQAHVLQYRPSPHGLPPHRKQGPVAPVQWREGSRLTHSPRFWGLKSPSAEPTWDGPETHTWRQCNPLPGGGGAWRGWGRGGSSAHVTLRLHVTFPWFIVPSSGSKTGITQGTRLSSEPWLWVWSDRPHQHSQEALPPRLWSPLPGAAENPRESCPVVCIWAPRCQEPSGAHAV